jgi:hypothetical protein
MKEQSYLHLLNAYKVSAESIFHTPKFDTAYSKALKLIHTILSKTVSELKISWEDTTNNEYKQLIAAEHILMEYIRESPDKDKKEVIDNFKTVLIEKLNRMIQKREKESNLSKEGTL